MTSKYLLVFVLLFFSGIAFSDSISKSSDSLTYFTKSHKESPTAEELKKSFGQSSKIDLWKYFWRILFIFILLVGVIFAISKYTNGSLIMGNNSYRNNQFKLLSQQFLSSKQKNVGLSGFEQKNKKPKA